MSELKNCAGCGQVFAKTIRDICPACYRKEEAAFQCIYQFLRQRQNREATMQEIIEATCVEEALVIKFLKQNRLRDSEFPQLRYPCEQCSLPVSSGKYCQTCLNEIKQEWTEVKGFDTKTKRNAHDSAFYSVKYSKDIDKSYRK